MPFFRPSVSNGELQHTMRSALMNVQISAMKGSSHGKYPNCALFLFLQLADRCPRIILRAYAGKALRIIDLGFRIMARDRVASIVKYCHVEDHRRHIFIHVEYHADKLFTGRFYFRLCYRCTCSSSETGGRFLAKVCIELIFPNFPRINMNT